MKDLTPEMMDLINRFANKLEVSFDGLVAHLYSISSKQVVMNFWISLFAIFVCFCITIPAVKHVYYIFSKDDDTPTPDSDVAKFVISCIVIVFSSIVLSNSLGCAVNSAFNPEYAAFINFLELLKKMK